MPSWLIKAAAQRIVGALPNAHRWNELLQTHVAHSLRLSPERFAGQLRACGVHFEYFRQCRGGNPGDFSVLEVGTGWHPIVPVGLWLAGAREVETWDLAPHATPERLQATIRMFVEADRSQLAKHLPVIPGRLERLAGILRETAPADLMAQLGTLGITFHIGDLGQSAPRSAPPDFILSHAVLEYFTYDQLVGLLTTFKRISGPNTVMSHWVDYGDEYAYFDRKISFFNFLRYSDPVWRLINNPIIPLSRLRITDHRRAFQDAGFTIVKADVVRGKEDELARIPLASRFRSYPVNDLLVLEAWLVAKPG
ncbi:hypothetical protein [Azospirillum sp. sgz302134]